MFPRRQAAHGCARALLSAVATLRPTRACFDHFDMLAHAVTPRAHAAGVRACSMRCVRA